MVDLKEKYSTGINTKYGLLMPQYEDDGVRRKYIKPLTFYNNGALKSIELQKQEQVQTVVGLLPAEHIIFYESGIVKRIFPLNGKITGYWTEEDEFGLADVLSFEFLFGNVKTKVIGVYFYDGGGIKSITIWPHQKQLIQSPIGQITVRIGISMYPDGMLKSCEPALPTPIATPIGNIVAFDPNAIGINADNNSLEFDTTGNVKSVITSLNQIKVIDANGNVSLYEPTLKPSLFNPEKMDIMPIKVTFFDDKIQFNNDISLEYTIPDNTFQINVFVNKANALCSDCSNCTACD